LVISLELFIFVVDLILNIVLGALFVWLAYDVIRAIYTGKPWYYLNNNLKFNKFLKRNLGLNEAGRYKVYLLTSLIIILIIHKYTT
jgi:hypothetical protein